jgi:hypothetical protein
MFSKGKKAVQIGTRTNKRLLSRRHSARGEFFVGSGAEEGIRPSASFLQISDFQGT